MGPGAQNIDFLTKMNENGGRHHPNVNVNVHIPPGTPSKNHYKSLPYISSLEGPLKFPLKGAALCKLVEMDASLWKWSF